MRFFLAFTVALAENLDTSTLPDINSDFDAMDKEREKTRHMDQEVREMSEKFEEGLKQTKELEKSIHNHHHHPSALLQTGQWEIPVTDVEKSEDARLARMRKRIADEAAGFAEEAAKVTPESILADTPFGAPHHVTSLASFIQEDPTPESVDAAKVAALESAYADEEAKFKNDRKTAHKEAEEARQLEGKGMSTSSSFLQESEDPYAKPFVSVVDKLKAMTKHMHEQAQKFRDEDFESDDSVKVALAKFQDDDHDPNTKVEPAKPESLIQVDPEPVDGIAELKAAIKNFKHLKPEFEKKSAKVSADIDGVKSSFAEVDADTTSEITESSLLGEWEKDIESRDAKRAARHQKLLSPAMEESNLRKQ